MKAKTQKILNKYLRYIFLSVREVSFFLIALGVAFILDLLTAMAANAFSFRALSSLVIGLIFIYCGIKLHEDPVDSLVRKLIIFLLIGAIVLFSYFRFAQHVNVLLTLGVSGLLLGSGLVYNKQVRWKVLGTVLILVSIVIWKYI